MPTDDLPDIPFDTPTLPPPKKALPKVNGAHESFENAVPVAVERADLLKTPDPAPIIRATLPIVGRTLPHSLEAEENLLSCCLIDGPDVIPRAIEAHIQPKSFYDTKHGIIFEHLLALHARNLPIDVAIVAEELKTARQLDQVGGYAFLTQITERQPTTAQSGYFIEKVREQALLREIIRSATGTVEDCYGFSGGIDEFVQEAAEKMKSIFESGSSADMVMAKLEASRYSPERRLPDVAPVFFLGKVPVCTRGNLITLTAMSKVGKSSFMAGVLAATFKDPDHGGDTFTVRSDNPQHGAVIHFDTEQHAKTHEKMMDGVMKRAGAVQLPPWVCSYARKGTQTAQLRQELEAVLKTKARRFKSIHSVHLDGVADFVNDVNDPKEVNPFVTWLESLAVKYDCPILCILHLNPMKGKDSTEKSRGHLGSQLQRKVETDLRLKKESKTVTVVFTEPSGTRGAPVFEEDGPRFAWDQDAHMHLTCVGAQDSKDTAKRDQLRDFAEDVFDRAGHQRLRYAELIRAIEAAGGVATKRAEARFTELKKFSVIAKDLVGQWTLVTLE